MCYFKKYFFNFLDVDIFFFLNIVLVISLVCGG